MDQSNTTTTDSGSTIDHGRVSQENFTHSIAAELVAEADDRPVTLTPFEQFRRHEGPDEPYRDRARNELPSTRAHARAIMDAAAAYEGFPGHLADLTQGRIMVNGKWMRFTPADYRAAKRAVDAQRGRQ